MREHALPQDVTSYKFHIIGNMTLRQFAEVAGGCAIGFLIYLTNLPALIKWPIILIFAGAGAIAAFLPIAERPLDQWLIALFKALYRPTLFYWRRTSKIPDPFLHKSNEDVPTLVADIDLTPARRQRVKEFLHSVQTTEQKDSLELYTDQRLQEVMTIFGPDSAGNLQVAPNAAAPAYSYAAPAVPPADQVSAQTMAAPEPNSDTFAAPPVEPVAPAPTKFAPILQAAAGLAETPAAPSAQPVSIPQNQPAGTAPQTVEPIAADAAMPAPVTVFAAEDTTFAQQPTAYQPSQAAAAQFGDTPNAPTGRSVAVPQTQNVVVEPVAQTVASPTLAAQQTVSDSFYTTTQQALSPQQPNASAGTNPDLPFPSLPTEPNKVVGMVLDAANTPLANVIVEIRTPEGLPARAVKTNTIGQFFITTPLANGNYVVVAEREGSQFAPLSLQLTGAVVPPIEVKSLS